MKILLLSLLTVVSLLSFGNESKSDLNSNLLASIEHSKLKKFEKLLNLGADPNYRDVNGDPSQRPVVMELAAIHKNSSYLKLALIHGGNPNALDGYKSKTILFEAASSSKLNNVKILVDAGALLVKLNGNGETPLHIAIAVKNYDIAYYLIKKGASLKTPDKWGYTPFDMLIKYGDAGVKKGSEQYQWYLKVKKMIGVKDAIQAH